jgi:hypothetical protein
MNSQTGSPIRPFQASFRSSRGIPLVLPSSRTTRVHCRNLLRLNMEMERAEGFEPSPSLWKSDMLPLHYTRYLKNKITKLLTASSPSDKGTAQRPITVGHSNEESWSKFYNLRPGVAQTRLSMLRSLLATVTTPGFFLFVGVSGNQGVIPLTLILAKELETPAFLTKPDNHHANPYHRQAESRANPAPALSLPQRSSRAEDRQNHSPRQRPGSHMDHRSRGRCLCSIQGDRRIRLETQTRSRRLLRCLRRRLHLLLAGQSFRGGLHKDFLIEERTNISAARPKRVLPRGRYLAAHIRYLVLHQGRAENSVDGWYEQSSGQARTSAHGRNLHLDSNFPSATTTRIVDGTRASYGGSQRDVKYCTARPTNPEGFNQPQGRGLCCFSGGPSITGRSLNNALQSPHGFCGWLQRWTRPTTYLLNDVISGWCATPSHQARSGKAHALICESFWAKTMGRVLITATPLATQPTSQTVTCGITPNPLHTPHQHKSMIRADHFLSSCNPFLSKFSKCRKVEMRGIPHLGAVQGVPRTPLGGVCYINTLI